MWINVKERKLFESTQYLITIARRLMSDMPFGIEKECYFISEEIRIALKNIGTKQAKFFVKEIEQANLQEKFSKKSTPTSHNKDCAVQPTASAKFPSLEEIFQNIQIDFVSKETAVVRCYETIKKLGNFG